MSSVRARLAQGVAKDTVSLGRLGLGALALLLMLAIYVVAVSVERIEDAPLLVLAAPLALASIAYGLRGGIAAGTLASLVAAA